MTQLSLHFTLDELCITGTGLPNVPNKKELENLTYLCEQLELVRELFDGAAIIVSSGFRCKSVNSAVGGAKTSHHLLGSAADFSIKGFTPYEIVEKIAESDIEYCQIIQEFGKWVHFSAIKSNNKREILTASKINGKTVYTVGNHK